jgi:hypothetical protein
MSLPAFLGIAEPTIGPLLEKRVAWAWIGARVIAVYDNPTVDPLPDLPALDAKTVRRLVVARSRMRGRPVRSQPTGSTNGVGNTGPPQSTAEIGTESKTETETVTEGAAGAEQSGSNRARPEASDLFDRIIAADEAISNLGKHIDD